MGMRLFNKTRENVFHPMFKKDFGRESLEKTLEDWLGANPQILGDNILLIGRQVKTRHGIIDLLALDPSGNTLVIELKRGRAPREVIAQLNSYLTIVEQWNEHDLLQNANLIPFSRETNNLIKKFKEHFKCDTCPELNAEQVGIVVAEDYEADFATQLGGLKYGCRALQFSNFVDKRQEEYLLINPIYDSVELSDARQDRSGERTNTEYSQVPSETREKFYDLAQSVYRLIEAEVCSSSEGWRLHESKQFVQAVFSCWRVNWEGISLYYDPKAKKNYLHTNMEGKHKNLLLPLLEKDKLAIEAALGKGVLWDQSRYECLGEWVGDNPIEVAARVKAYIRTLKPYLDQVLPRRDIETIDQDERVIRKQFWSQLLSEANKVTPLHSNISPGANHWIGVNAGKRGLVYNYVVLKHEASVELYIDSGKQDDGENKDIFKSLEKYKNAINSEFNGGIEWQLLPEKRACRIKVKACDNGIADHDKWAKVHKALVKTMVRFEKALRPYIAKLE